LTVTNRYDQYLRRTNLCLFNGSTLLTRSTNSYDSASRLATVSDGTNSATYSYLANSPLVSQITFVSNGVQRMVTTKQYDLLNRLTNTASVSSVASWFVYAYNSANQRTRTTLADGSYWVYAYDSLGQVVSGRKYWSDGTAVAGQQFEYAFDDIGNRKTTGSGGDHDQYGGALHYASYWANSLNQYTSRDVPGYVNVIGSAKTNATVSLWTPDGYWAQTSRKADYFRGELPLNNATGALWLTITNLAVLNNGTNPDILTNTVGNAFVARTPEAFAYDADGNLSSNGRFTITWDAENRAVSFTSLSNAPSASKTKVDCAYDWLGRRTQKIVSVWNGSAYVAQSTNRFVYDGWNLIAVLNATNGPLRSFTWGLDLSGSPRGAGGVGGLLAVCDSVQGTHFAAFDGKGNVAALVKASDGTISAQYEYGPFGEVIRETGPMAKANPLRFSTKCQDDETDLLYYGYRYYGASTGRWIGRDPAGEQGGMNVYGFVENNPVNSFDLLGLLDYYLGNTDPTYTPPPTGQTPIAPTVGLRARWLIIDGAAVAEVAVYPHAAGFLTYYLNGDGTPVKVSVDDMLNDSVNARTVYRAELTQAIAFAATLAKKPSGDYDIDSRTASQGEFRPSDSKDWFLAIGRYVAWGKGKAHVKDCKVTLDFTYEFRKRYQWQVDQGKSVTLLGLTITDAQMGELSEAGLAKEFDITGEKSETVNATDPNATGPSSPPPIGR